MKQAPNMTQNKPKIVIIDSGCANIASVRYALERLGYEGTLTSDTNEIKSASRVILPGVGTARAAMTQLHERDLVDTIKSLTQPVMGICLGMQLLFQHSQELDTDMLGIIPANITKFDDSIDIIPHMGWNNVSFKNGEPLFKSLVNDSYFYFVHSYFAPVGEYTIGQCNYGGELSAIVNHKNFYGCQFHPERSGEAGSALLKNFIEGDL